MYTHPGRLPAANAPHAFTPPPTPWEGPMFSAVPLLHVFRGGNLDLASTCAGRYRAPGKGRRLWEKTARHEEGTGARRHRSSGRRRRRWATPRRWARCPLRHPVHRRPPSPRVSPLLRAHLALRAGASAQKTAEYHSEENGQLPGLWFHDS
jgi:hypothetical protein